MIIVLVRAAQRLLRPAQSIGRLMIGATSDLVRTRSELLAENALLRRQVVVLRRNIDRPRLHRDDRLLLLALARLTRRWRGALHVVRPETLLRWHRDLFKIIWRRKSRPRGQPKRLAPQIVTLIRAIAKQNVLWGAERIRGELLKLGIRVSKRTIQKYMKCVRPPGKRGQSWSAFIGNHSREIWACDFLQLYDALFRPIFAFFFVNHRTREVVHFNVTHHPTDAWIARLLRGAPPFRARPKYLIRDNDRKFGSCFKAVAEVTGIEIVKVPPSSPNLNPICERILGSVRRECLDHMLVLGERQLHVVVDADTGEFLASTLTSHRARDSAQVSDLLTQIDDQLPSARADGAYDTAPVYDTIAVRGSDPPTRIRIPPRRDAKIRVKTNGVACQRNATIRAIDAVGRRRWEQASGYTLRSLVETPMSRYKAIFGGSKRSRTMASQKVEATLACAIMNRMTLLGMPDGYCIA